MRAQCIRAFALLACRGSVSALLLAGVCASHGGFNFASAQPAEEDLSLDFVKKQLAKVRSRTPAAGEPNPVSPQDLQAETDRLLAEESALLNQMTAGQMTGGQATAGQLSDSAQVPAPAQAAHMADTQQAARTSAALDQAIGSLSTDSSEPIEEIRGAVAAVKEREIPGSRQVSKSPAAASPKTSDSTEDEVDAMLASVESPSESPRAMVASDALPAEATEKSSSVSQKKLSSLQNSNAELRRQVDSLQRRLRDATKELDESRNRLMIAETEVERLSNVLESRNRATLTRVAPSVVQSQPRREYRAPQAAAPQSAAAVTRTSTSAQEKPKTDMLVGTVMADKAHLRSGPGKNNSPLMSVARGTRLVIETRQGEWYRVITPTGTRAWVSNEVISFGSNGTGSPTRTVKIQGLGG